MSTTTTKPDTIVLIHGLCMTPVSWQGWVERYQQRGYKVLAPAYPGLEGRSVEELRRDPSPIEKLDDRRRSAHHYETIIRALDKPPIIMGHSFGGAFTQILLDRGLGVAGVAIDSAPVKGVLKLPSSTIKASLPVLSNPSNRHKAVPFTPEQFHYAFTNTLTADESQKVYERYAMPAPGRVAVRRQRQRTSTRTRRPRSTSTRKIARRCCSSPAARTTHPAVARTGRTRSTTSSGVIAYKEFPGRSHYTLGQDGWEEVADYALAWALEPSASPVS